MTLIRRVAAYGVLILISVPAIVSCGRTLSRGSAAEILKKAGRNGAYGDVSITFDLAFVNNIARPNESFESWDRFMKLMESAGVVTGRSESVRERMTRDFMGNKLGSVTERTVQYTLVSQPGVQAYREDSKGAVVVAKWECSGVSGIRLEGESEAIVEADWKVAPTPLYGKVREACDGMIPDGSDWWQSLIDAINKAQSKSVERQNVLFVKYDDGWRVKEYL